jgi:hypothetical protein
MPLFYAMVTFICNGPQPLHWRALQNATISKINCKYLQNYAYSDSILTDIALYYMPIAQLLLQLMAFYWSVL